MHPKKNIFLAFTKLCSTFALIFKTVPKKLPSYRMFLINELKKIYLPNKLLKISIISCLLLLLNKQIIGFSENENVIIKTVYNDGFFHTEASLKTNASTKIMSELILNIGEHLRNLEIELLEWSTVGLSGKDGSSLMQIEYVKSTYNSDTEIFELFLDVYFMKRQFKNINVTVLLKTFTDSNGYPAITVKSNSPNSLLRNVEGTLFIKQTHNSQHFAVHSSVRFGWFFNMFITTSMYRNVAEWRLETFLKNLKTEAERAK
jgi:hypothetical protein